MTDTQSVYVVVSNPPETSASYILWDNAYTNKQKAKAKAESESFTTVKKLDIVKHD